MEILPSAFVKLLWVANRDLDIPHYLTKHNIKCTFNHMRVIMCKNLSPELREKHRIALCKWNDPAQWSAYHDIVPDAADMMGKVRSPNCPTRQNTKLSESSVSLLSH